MHYENDPKKQANNLSYAFSLLEILKSWRTISMNSRNTYLYSNEFHVNTYTLSDIQNNVP